MARMYQARCLRDTVMDDPYQFFRAGQVYTVQEDWPVLSHFERIGAELPQKEVERIEEERAEKAANAPFNSEVPPIEGINKVPPVTEGPKLKPPPKSWPRP